VFSVADEWLHDLYIAIGQMIFYQFHIDRAGFKPILHLAIPQSVFEVLPASVLELFRQYQIKLIIVDLEKESIVQWILS
jgi:hypothetical protein